MDRPHSEQFGACKSDELRVRSSSRGAHFAIMLLNSHRLAASGRVFMLCVQRRTAVLRWCSCPQAFRARRAVFGHSRPVGYTGTRLLSVGMPLRRRPVGEPTVLTSLQGNAWHARSQTAQAWQLRIGCLATDHRVDPWRVCGWSEMSSRAAESTPAVGWPACVLREWMVGNQ